MKAVRFSKYGAPDVLKIEEVDDPIPGPGEALVKVSAAAINPSDVKNVAGMFSASMPRIPGRDYAGTVVSSGYWQGREVWGSGAGFGVLRDGAQCQYLVVPKHWLSAKPENLSMAQAATVGIPYVTAWSALITVGKIQAGETLVVNGSGGAVGSAAIQIAHWRGARAIGIGISDRPSEADFYINARHQDIQTYVAEATNGKGADIALDTVGGPAFESTLKSLGRSGRHIAIASSGNRRVEFDLIDFYHQELRLYGLDTMKLNGSEIASILDVLREGFRLGALHPQDHFLWSMEDVVDAYVAAYTGITKQRQVISVK